MEVAEKTQGQTFRIDNAYFSVTYCACKAVEYVSIDLYHAISIYLKTRRFSNFHAVH